MNTSMSMPEGLILRYRWCEGSVPPPDHYEYVIEIGAGGGRIEFCPDYPAEGVPVWVEEFNVASEALESLYMLMLERRMFRDTWTAVADPPVGGSLEWLEGEVRGEHFTVPSAIEESDTVREVYVAIRALVPDDVWSDLTARCERYHEGVED